MATRKQPVGLEVRHYGGDTSLYEATKRRIGTERRSPPSRLVYRCYVVDPTESLAQQFVAVGLLSTEVEAVERGDGEAIARVALGESN
jgi:hypothetical protein